MIWPPGLDPERIDEMTDEELVAAFVEKAGYERPAARFIVEALRGRSEFPLL